MLLETVMTTGNSWSETVEFKRAAVDLDDLAKRSHAVIAVTLGIDDLALVKGNIREMQVGFDNEQAGHLCALDHLHRVKNADDTPDCRQT